MPSILKAKSRRVLRYFNKYGFKNTNLTIYIMDNNCTLNEVVKFEQYFIDTLSPNLNVDLVASGSGYHTPMTQEVRDKLRQERGTPIYIYNSENFELLHVFKSKQHCYDTISIHHNILSNCLSMGDIYLDSFFFSLDLIEESIQSNLLTLEEINEVVFSKKKTYTVKHPASKIIIAYFNDDYHSQTLTFPSLNSLAKHLKGDRKVIRDYLKGEKSGYYRGK